MRVLFVDDEPRVLEGLERSLDVLNDEDWQLEFVGSGAAALTQLGASDFDAIVTDMRMPGIDGAAVLARATEIAPRAARIVLSAEMKDESATRALAHAHQILGKPCKPELMMEVLRSSTRFRSLLDSDGLRQAVIAIDRLPAIPTTYREIQAELARPSVSPQTLARIVAADPGLTARMVQVANSPYFGGGRRIDDLRQVIARLGVQMISALALAAVFDRQDADSQELDLRDIADRALRTAGIAGRLGGRESGQAYLAGMLTDVGRIVLAITRPDQFDRAVEEARVDAAHALEIERTVCGVGHADVGAYLLALWGLPAGVVDAVAQHHCELAELIDRGAPPLVIATAVAAALAAGLAPDPALLARAGYDGRTLESAMAAA